ncbi:nicotinamide riboside transporter PnuC [Gammaproteobacteria bacterium]|nr:nicotinamide riboside transporter PnuC [Gammaproteobacteria bacterium]MDB4094576.1 nicotinamide riboside transporter PnuC [Gammaproteobacteria bacterium]MDB9900270.1 nicotinamide riboside transporter PnuC [Gammaproteobacteria bacterium]MDC0122798.1 nicotinamide riboside transporter PnuC [Gammaproteobacteria bacterium]MDC0905689.1 nicotinamide riboside transporter PnuC [Gammaproteobacteria bacterium]
MISNFIVQNWLEITAVIFAILYLILAVKQNILCWIAGIISSVLYFFIMQKAGLYMEAYLQVFYVVMGIYGWSQWSASNVSNPSFIVNTWSKYQHMIAISTILALSLLSGFLLERYTDAALPFLDALVSWGAVVATYMVAKKLLENWIYWFVIDATSIFLFIERGLWLSAVLFAAYLVIIFFGYQSWNKVRGGQKYCL